MNIITNLLFSIYLYFLLGINSYYFYIIVLGILFPNMEIILLMFFKNKLKLNNKIFHSFIILTIINLFISMAFTMLMDLRFINILFFLLLGNSIHLLSDLFKNKFIYLLYPLKKDAYNISISNYFDIIPVIILVVSNFSIIFLEIKINLIEKLIPIVLLFLYFLTAYIIKRIIYKKIILDLNDDYKVIVSPTLKITVWNIIRVTENNVYLFQLDIITRKYLFVKYFSNNILKTELDIINNSVLFTDFKLNHDYLYYQVYENSSASNNIKFVRVFDVRNFFNLFKREQKYYEAKFINDNLVKEKLIL